jgi:hypothetical protein
MKTTANWLPSLVSALVVITTSFSPQIQEYLSAHPMAMAVAAGVYAVLTHLLPSPVSNEKGK